MTPAAGIGWAFLLGALVIATPARPDAEAEAAGSRSDVVVHVTRDRGDYVVEGRCRTAASAAAAWAVLTDYDAIERFVPSMRESRVTERTGNHLLVEQIAIGRLFLFSRKVTVVLFVEEEPPGTIRFEDVLRRDFSMYRGEWRIEERDGGREIFYRVTARPSFRVPDMIARGMFARTARELLSEVGAEIARRAAAAPSPAPDAEPQDRPLAAPSGDGPSPQTHGKELE